MKKIICFIRVYQELEVLLPICEKIGKENFIKVDFYISKSLFQSFPRSKQLLKYKYINIIIKPKYILKYFAHFFIKKNDIIIGIYDPNKSRNPFRYQTRYIARKKIKFIFVQHGIIQENVNLFNSKLNKLPYYANLILLFQDLNTIKDKKWVKIKYHNKETKNIGFIKKYLPSLTPNTQLEKKLNQFERTILICHSYSWNDRFLQEKKEKFYKYLKNIIEDFPNYCFIIRSHRGKDKYKHNPHLNHKNIIFSLQNEGILQGSLINDILPYVDCVISHPSSVIIDAVYANKPVATFDNDQELYTKLEQVDTYSKFVNFIKHPSLKDSLYLKNIFGELEKNIGKTYLYIKKFINQ